MRFANVTSADKVLDVACGTSATFTSTDLTPRLVKRAKEKVCGLDIDFQESDVEDLPFEDDSFEIVLSHFGHIFAPRPAVALSEMLHVLKPNGALAFST